MNEELRIAFSKKEKIELFLSKLDKLKAGGSIPETQYQDLQSEYNVILDEANASIKTIKARLRKEFEKKALELEGLQKEHDLWQARLNVGEVRSETYWAQIKPLKKSIEQLKKEVPKLRIQVNAASSAEIGGPAKVEIPELKVKKTQLTSKARERGSRKSKEPDPAIVKTDASMAKRQQSPSKDKALVTELFKAPVSTAPKANDSTTLEKAYARERIPDETQELVQEREGITTGKLAAIIIAASLVIVVLIFVVGRIVSSSADHSAPIISGFSVSPVTGSSATIEWTTDEKATSQIMLRDPAGATIPVEPDKNMVTKHSMKVSGVKPNIRYQVTLKSADANGNEVEYKTEQTFMLAGATGTAVAIISDVSVLDIADTSAVIIWKTDKPATGQVMVIEAGSKSPFVTEPRTDLTTSHAIILANLKPNVTYTFTLLFKDASGTQATYDPGKTFTTLAFLPVGYEVGKSAPDFTLPTIDGKSLTLSSFRGKVVLLNFWQKACLACVREMPMIQSFFSKLSGDKVAILAVNAFEDEETIKSFKERWNLTFPILLDPKGTVVKDYNVSDIPVTFFINSQGVIKEIKVGPFGKVEEIESAINSLLNTLENK